MNDNSAMKSPRFHCPTPLAPGARFELPEPVARHAVRVLRLGVGAEIVLFDGRNGEYTARIEHADRERVTVSVGAWQDIERESPLKITLVQAVQAAEKMDLTIQKAVELGVGTIVPVTSRRSVVRLSGERADRRVAHWQAVAVAACEQCGRNHIPVVAPLQSLEQWLAVPGSGAARLMLAPGAEIALGKLPAAAAVELLVGAEGGLDPAEIAAAEHAGFVAVSLGPRILRTETAGLAAVAAMQALWGDFRGG